MKTREEVEKLKLDWRRKNMSAFPLFITSEDYDKGMTLRDYFAGQALAGLSSLTPPDPGENAYIAYKYADAMLAEREKLNGKVND